MTKKKTHEQFIKEFNEKNPNANNIEILGKYDGNSKPISCRCKIDGHKWSPRPCHLLGSKNTKPSGCPKCSGKAKKTTEEFKIEMKIINPNIKIIGGYKGCGKPIKCKCLIDGFEWSPLPDNLLQNHGCPKCGGQLKKDHEEFAKEIKEINPNIEIMSKYNGVHNHIDCKCTICNHEWKTRPHELLDEYGCPLCSISRGELKVKNVLENLNIVYIFQHKFEDCKFYNKLPFDFYIPSLNTIIEYDGEQHFKIIKKFGGFDRFVDNKIRDTIKTKYCQDNNINLIRIPYWDYDNIENILSQLIK